MMLLLMEVMRAMLASASLLLTGCAGASGAAVPGDDAPTSEPAIAAPADNATAHSANQETPTDVAGMLDQIERATDGLTGFTADIIHRKDDALLGQQTTRMGELIYWNAPLTKSNDAETNAHAVTAEKRFAVLFHTLIDGQRKREREQHYVFDGRWLAEIDHARKEFIKREIVPPGEVLDPLKLGEGPFPMPIGQPRAEVEKHFEVSLLDAPPTEGLLSKLQNVQGLRLVPKARRPEAKHYASIDLFYDRETWLPIGVLATVTNDDIEIVRLDNLHRNPVLDDALRGKLRIENPPADSWMIDIRPWQGE